jgi:hypothetical protein
MVSSASRCDSAPLVGTSLLLLLLLLLITKLQNQIQKNEEKPPKYMMSLKAAETALTKRNNKI